ncbi:hypothetical protein T10_6707 [Trichinella papuae]|uniref:Uncharacterized protein n=1 Tax=Trichinella papuae TaxID=268474 RepID=A0A0V1MY68_9BILA|nr:hypothetical protein T10_6707 [Trichinella papuae]
MIGILIDSKKNEDVDDTKQSGKQKGECELFPCSLSRQSAGSWSLMRGRPILTAQKREGCFALSPKVQGGAVCRSFPDTARVGEISRFCELYTGEEGGRPLVPQPGEEEVSCENMDFHHLRQLGSHGEV